MDARQENRFDEFMNSNFEDKKVRELLQEIMGGKAKFSDEIVQAFRITGKIYVG
jgi:hypothetical protein